MRKILLIMMLFLLPVRANAVQLTAPDVPESAADIMTDGTNFADGLQEILGNVLPQLRPDFAEAAKISLGVIAVVLMISLLLAALILGISIWFLFFS